MNSPTRAPGGHAAACRVYQRGFQPLCAYFQAHDRERSGTLARSQFKRALLDLNIGRALDSMTADILLNQGAHGTGSRQSFCCSLCALHIVPASACVAKVEVNPRGAPV